MNVSHLDVCHQLFKGLKPLKSCSLFILHLFVAIFFLQACSSSAGPKDGPPPNIIFILADDLSYRDLGYLGQKAFSTPSIDRLAANGLRFSQAYAGSSLCAPSRASLMTGMHMGHSRVRNNLSVRGQDHLEDEDVTVAEALKNAGYATGFIGKWGIGMPGTEGAPERQGFDYAFGFYDQRRAHSFFPEYLMENGEKVYLPENDGFNMWRVYKFSRSPVDGDGELQTHYNAEGKLVADGVADPTTVKYSEELFRQAALSFIDKNREEPFFLYYATQLPHGPNIAPDLGAYKDKDWPLRNKEWAAMMGELDHSVEAIIDKLDQDGLLENTVVFFAGDNGYSMHGYMGRKAWEDDPIFHNKGPWRAGKASNYEGGLRVPFFVYWKGKVQPRESSHITALYDFFPTAVSLSGSEQAYNTDGISLLPEMENRPKDQQAHDYLYWERSESLHEQSVRLGKWYAYRAHPDQPLEVYDIEKAPASTNDLALEHPEVVQQVLNVFEQAHSPSTWYINPGESEESVNKKRKMAEDNGELYPSQPPNKIKADQ